MSIATVVTRGYGSFGTISEVVTRGYSIGAVDGVAARNIGAYQQGGHDIGAYEGPPSVANLQIGIEVPFQIVDLQIEQGLDYSFNITVPFQASDLQIISGIDAQIAIEVPFQTIDLQIAAGDPDLSIGIEVPLQTIILSLLPRVEPTITIEVPIQPVVLNIGIDAAISAQIGIDVPIQTIALVVTGTAKGTLIVAALLSKTGSWANTASPINPGPAALTSQMVCDTSEL